MGSHRESEGSAGLYSSLARRTLVHDMARSRITVLNLAREAGLDLDEVLVLLWDAGFSYVRGPTDSLAAGAASRARRAVGLATRRDMESPEFWQRRLGVDEAGLIRLLVQLGVDDYQAGQRLPKRTLGRLRGEDAARVKIARTEQARAESATRAPPFMWKSVGRHRDCKTLTPADVLRIHEALVQDFATSPDPIVPSGVKSEPLLASACHRPLTSNGSERKYPTIEMAAAALLHALVHDHPFHNGNKRTALVAMLSLLDANGLVFTCHEDELFKLVLQLAQHSLATGPRSELADRETLHVAKFLHSNTRWVEMGSRPVQWRRLRKILASYGCSLTPAPGVGNRLDITRIVTRPGRFFSRDRIVCLNTQTAHTHDGGEASRGTVAKIRRELELDEEHGVDSLAFCDSVPMTASDFILRYRKTMRRLARL